MNNILDHKKKWILIVIGVLMLILIGMLIFAFLVSSGLLDKQKAASNTTEVESGTDMTDGSTETDAVAESDTKLTDETTDAADTEDSDVDDMEVIEPDDPMYVEANDYRIMTFVDAHGEEYSMEINPDVKAHDYRLDAFVRQGENMTYTDTDQYDYRLGIDVSSYQGNIDWAKVKAAGYDFAFVRVGFRGYGQAGTLNADQKYAQNIQGAQAAGLDVGVYFYAQAITEEEAIEEAEYVMRLIDGYTLQLPLVYDPESVLGKDARTDGVSGEQFTKNSKAFCETVKAAGYDPMIYCNMKWEAFFLDLTVLEDYPIWYADYEPKPQTPYDFAIWQYTNEGRVDGISSDVDIDIWLTSK